MPDKMHMTGASTSISRTITPGNGESESLAAEVQMSLKTNFTDELLNTSKYNAGSHPQQANRPAWG
jgi:hypothetical protein